MKIQNSKQFREQVLELLNKNETQENILKLAEKAFNSGMMDTENINTDDYSRAMATLCAIFNTLEWQYRPRSKEALEITQNLKHVI